VPGNNNEDVIYVARFSDLVPWEPSNSSWKR